MQNYSTSNLPRKVRHSFKLYRVSTKFDDNDDLSHRLSDENIERELKKKRFFFQGHLYFHTKAYGSTSDQRSLPSLDLLILMNDLLLALVEIEKRSVAKVLLQIVLLKSFLQ
ncbi:hypothetical protein LOAG_13697 [Loa loa]|uniref:Uncharacterized protein n=1 Tax=Loa loa TaxID=7209 RepID=A0A1S0TKE2_LOALO|nr:hypothetical protein LOAG_13697 [Loa loa]EFO14818.1 hypothetical protein LOAG_13697 [Loa loa]